METDPLLFFWRLSLAAALGLLASARVGERANAVLVEDGERSFLLVGINLEEDVGNVLVGVVEKCFFAAGVKLDKISQIQHLFLVEIEIAVLLPAQLRPLLG